MAKIELFALLALCCLAAGRVKGSFSDDSHKCPKGTPIVSCLVNPCDTHKCPEFPRATCKPNYCGGCFAEFHGTYPADMGALGGQRVDRTYDCASTAYENVSGGKCGPGIPNVKCVVDPCKVTKCTNYPRATCRANYCGGCFAEFYDVYRNAGALSGMSYEVTDDCNDSTAKQ